MQNFPTLPFAPWNFLFSQDNQLFSKDKKRNDALSTPQAQAIAQFNQNFEHMLDNFFSVLPGLQMMNELLPSVEMDETDDEYQFSASFPGLEETDLEVHVKNGRLYIGGANEAGNRRNDNGKVQNMFVRNAFSHSVTLPVNADAANIQADFEDGELRITVPKLVDAESRVRINNGRSQRTVRAA